MQSSWETFSRDDFVVSTEVTTPLKLTKMFCTLILTPSTSITAKQKNINICYNLPDFYLIFTWFLRYNYFLQYIQSYKKYLIKWKWNSAARVILQNKQTISSNKWCQNRNVNLNACVPLGWQSRIRWKQWRDTRMSWDKELTPLTAEGFIHSFFIRKALCNILQDFKF